MTALGLASFGVTFGSGVAYQCIGSYVDVGGVLREPFGFIPIGWLSATAGVVLVSLGVWRMRCSY